MPKLIVLFRPATIALASVLVLLAACEREVTTEVPVGEQTPPAPVVVTLPVLDRAGLLGALDRAASAYAAGEQDTQESLSGRRFLIRQAMGCEPPLTMGANGPEGEGVLVQADRSPDLKLTLSPADWTWALDHTEGWEAAEGFWLAWPWMRTDGCPQTPLTTETAPVVEDNPAEEREDAALPITASARPTPHTAGLAAVFAVDGSRVKRRMGRAYEFTLRGENKMLPAPDPAGYRVVLEGRMAAFADDRSIRCHAASADQRPVCIAAVHLERVAFETSSGQILGEWRGG